MNGVCVKWVGWIDLETLNGKAKLLFDEEQAKVRMHFLVANCTKKKYVYKYYNQYNILIMYNCSLSNCNKSSLPAQQVRDIERLSFV